MKQMCMPRTTCCALHATPHAGDLTARRICAAAQLFMSLAWLYLDARGGFAANCCMPIRLLLAYTVAWGNYECFNVMASNLIAFPYHSGVHVLYTLMAVLVQALTAKMGCHK